MAVEQIAEPRPATTGAVAGDFHARAANVAAVAAAHALAVDSASRFPSESFSAVKAQRLLGIMVPRDLGGEGANLTDVVDVCYGLGRACSATAMVYAMHQTKVACISRHARGSAWHERLLRRLPTEQLLLASSTTEGQSGGDVRKSAAAIEARLSDGRGLLAEGGVSVSNIFTGDAPVALMTMSRPVSAGGTTVARLGPARHRVTRAAPGVIQLGGPAGPGTR